MKEIIEGAGMALLIVFVCFALMFFLDVLPLEKIKLSQKQNILQYEISIKKLELQKIELQKKIKEAQEQK